MPASDGQNSVETQNFQVSGLQYAGLALPENLRSAHVQHNVLKSEEFRHWFGESHSPRRHKDNVWTIKPPMHQGNCFPGYKALGGKQGEVERGGRRGATVESRQTIAGGRPPAYEKADVGRARARPCEPGAAGGCAEASCPSLARSTRPPMRRPNVRVWEMRAGAYCERVRIPCARYIGSDAQHPQDARAGHQWAVHADADRAS